METASWYRFFANVETKATSPRYQVLADGVADDAELIGRLDRLPAPKRQPNLLFASVQYLDGPTSEWGLFRSFTLDHWDLISSLMVARSTQTNEPARCATLLPVLGLLPQPLALIEVGASAGLCLIPDRYSYAFNGRVVGDSPLRMDVHCTGPVPVPPELPDVSWRCGIDLNPLDVDDPRDVAWLRACIWPEHAERRRRLDLAVSVAASDPPRVVRGDLLEQIEGVMADAPSDATPVVFHSAVLAYLTEERRAVFASLMAARPDIVWISNEGPGVVAGVVTPDEPPSSNAFIVGRDGNNALAYADPHGSWLAWLPSSATMQT